jgi:RNA polymerase sigma factor (sigma-70 family)
MTDFSDLESDRQLVAHCLAGDASAWEQLYRQCQRTLLFSIRLVLGPGGADDDLVEEIAAEVWASLIEEDGQQLRGFDPDRKTRLVTYLCHLARRHVQQRRRSDSRRQAREVAVSRGEAASSASIPHETQRLLEEFLKELTPREREFCVDYLLAAKPVESKFSPTNVWQLRHRVHEKLKRFLAEA